MTFLKSILTSLLSLLCFFCLAQEGTIRGVVRDEKGNPPAVATVALKNTKYFTETAADGSYELKNIPKGNYTLMAFSLGSEIAQQDIVVHDHVVTVDFNLVPSTETLQEVVVESQEEKTLGLRRLNAIDNFGVYEGKKTEVVVLGDITANTATNNARQIYSKVTGLNIWESDGAGLQLGIGGRGLSPNRTSNFNTRQSGYDISADALGYPESYYTPPTEALEQIEIVRGAASLQYGTQFGGLLNFKFKRGPTNKKIDFTTRQTLGPWNFYGTFNSIGGTIAKGKLNYYAYYNYKKGDGYRQNSKFDYHNAYGSIRYQVNPNLEVNVDFTRMSYLAQQPGGLTDKLFDADPRQSLRSRNWFKVDWNLAAVILTYKFSASTQLNVRNFGLLASRKALGNLDPINVTDLGDYRTLIDGQFKNVGNETRLLHRYKFLGRQSAMVAGVRLYHGTTTAKQGDADNGTGPVFTFLHPENVENSNYTFPNENYAAFLENIFDITPKLSITPGLRFENIRTFSDGYYQRILRNGAGTIISQKKISESQARKRSFLLGGLGISYKHSDKTEYYANISQNYRAINFTDLRIANPSFVVDSTIRDEKGYTADIGVRGTAKDIFRYEATLFYVSYKGRIGQMVKTDSVTYNDYRYRTNIADARNIGIEAFGEVILSKLFNPQSEALWSLFVNASVIDARYMHSKYPPIRNKKVEMVPPVMIRTGTTFRHHGFSSTLQFSYISQHYSDATNAKRTATAIEGIIPPYMVADLSASYQWKMLTLEASCNNLFNQHYFTRRAESYPGPGIIPSDGRGIYATLQARIGK